MKDGTVKSGYLLWGVTEYAMLLDPKDRGAFATADPPRVVPGVTSDFVKRMAWRLPKGLDDGQSRPLALRRWFKIMNYTMQKTRAGDATSLHLKLYGEIEPSPYPLLPFISRRDKVVDIDVCNAASIRLDEGLPLSIDAWALNVIPESYFDVVRRGAHTYEVEVTSRDVYSVETFLVFGKKVRLQEVLGHVMSMPFTGAECGATLQKITVNGVSFDVPQNTSGREEALGDSWTVTGRLALLADRRDFMRRLDQYVAECDREFGPRYESYSQGCKEYQAMDPGTRREQAKRTAEAEWAECLKIRKNLLAKYWPNIPDPEGVGILRFVSAGD